MSSDEEKLRAQLEEEMRRITVDDLLVQSVVSLVNLAGRKAGIAEGTQDERDLAQVRTAIDAVTALLPVLEASRAGEAAGPIRDALAQLQMVYAREAQPGERPAAEPQEAPPEPPERPDGPQGPGPAQGSGRLWVPGQ